MLFMFITFILLGLGALIAPFFAENLKKSQGIEKVVAFGLFITVGVVFVSIGTYFIHDSYFKVYPSIEIENHVNNLFDDYNTIKDPFNGEQVIDIKNENSFIDCGDEYCRKMDYHYLFEAADLDSNQMVTKTELSNLIKTFDTNKDGLLNTPEAAIKTLFKETKDSETIVFYNKCPLVYGKERKKSDY